MLWLSESKRPCQRLKFTGCLVKIKLNEQGDGTWVVKNCILDHVGHPVTESNFYSHQQARKIDEDDKEFVKGLMRARTNAKNIADVLSERNGKSFNIQDVCNLITGIRDSEERVTSVEEGLGHIKVEM